MPKAIDELKKKKSGEAEGVLPEDLNWMVSPTWRKTLAKKYNKKKKK